jgi:hypothetical protein
MLRGAALCGACTTALIAAAVGVLLLVIGARELGATCTVPLARYALTDGALGLAVGISLAALAALAAAETAAPPPPQQQQQQQASLRSDVLVLASAALGLLVLAALGVRLWGTVLAFGGNLWAHMQLAAAAGTPPPCAPELYNVVAIVILVGWVTVALAVALGCCAVCCLAIGAGCFYLCCGLAERSRRLGRGGDTGDSSQKRVSDAAAGAEERELMLPPAPVYT